MSTSVSPPATHDENESFAGVEQEPKDGLELTWRWLWVGALVACLPMALPYFWAALSSGRFWFIPLVPVVVGVLVWKRASTDVLAPQSIFDYGLAGFALFSLLLAVVGQIAWFSALAMVLFGCVALRSMRGTLRFSLVAVCAPLLCLLRPPFGTESLIQASINRRSTWLSSIFLDGFGFFDGAGISHLRQGSNSIRLAAADLVTTDVTTGGFSVFVVIFIAFSLVAVYRMSLWLLPIYSIAAVFVTILLNAMRIALAAWILDSGGTEMGAGMSGAVTVLAIALAVGIMWSFHHLIAFVFHRIEYNVEAGANPFVVAWNSVARVSDIQAEEAAQKWVNSSPSESPLVAPSSKPRLAIVGSLVVVFLIASVQAARVGGAADPSFATAVSTPILDLNEDPLQKTSLTVNLASFEPNAIESDSDGNSRIDVWAGTFGEVPVRLQLHQTFASWREVTGGYLRDSWELLDRTVEFPEPEGDTGDEDLSDVPPDDLSELQIMTVDEPDDSFVSARLRRGDEQQVQGYLLVSGISESGKILEPPSTYDLFKRRIMRRLGRSTDGDERLMMLQMFVTAPERLSPEQVRGMKVQFTRIRSALAETVSRSATDASAVLTDQDISFTE